MTIEKLKELKKWIEESYKMLHEMYLRIEELERDFFAENKQECNPFKVGEKIYAFGRDITHKSEFEGVMPLTISTVGYKHVTATLGKSEMEYKFHYKQCELVKGGE